MGATLRVSSKLSMFDSPLRIWAENVVPNQTVTIYSRVSYQNEIYEAKADYVADKHGNVDCSVHPSVGGSFTGIHPMGLFWCLAPIDGQRRGLRLMPRSAIDPMTYELTLKNSNNEFLSNHVQLKRLLMHPDVERIEITEGRLRGALFLPKGSSERHRVPGIIDMYGTAGGLVEYRASLLASHGFAVFALAYFNYKDLPTEFHDIELEYFQEAANWFNNHPHVLHTALGIVGISFGADLAINLAMVSEKIKAVVSINGLHMIDSFNAIKYKSVLMNAVQADASHVHMVDGTLHYVNYRRALKDDPDLIYKIEQSNAQFLFLCSEDDQSTPAVHSARVLAERLKQSGKEENCHIKIYPKTGHLLEPPYIPFCPFSFHKVVGGFMAWGGEAPAHASSQEKFWKTLIKFFAENVGTPLKMSSISSNSKL